VGGAGHSPHTDGEGGRAQTSGGNGCNDGTDNCANCAADECAGGTGIGSNGEGGISHSSCTNGATCAGGGKGFKNGGTTIYSGAGATGNADGGFGGGGYGGGSNWEGGGGGGYNGGAGGNARGGGGGSYKAGLSSSSWTTAKGDGHGFVVVSKNPYSIKTSGQCTTSITDAAECKVAAFAVLGIETNTVRTAGTTETSSSGDARPWCYIKVSTGIVYTKHTSKSLGDCSSDRKCICADASGPGQ